MMTLDEAIEHYDSLTKQTTKQNEEYQQLKEWLEELERLKDKEFKYNDLMFYKISYIELCDSFNKHLVNPILGEHYYNYGCDVTSCNNFTCEDLKRKYDQFKTLNRVLIALSSVLFIIVVYMLFF